ncbi:MAG: glycosyltransferase, partial [Candidatus Paceibacterales bacterium]
MLLQECEIFLATSGNALSLLKIEFPQLHFFEIAGYNPVYPSGNGSMVWKMAFQLHKFLSTISKEQVQIEALVEQNQVDLVISDNRYGAFSLKAKSVFITHQLNIPMPSRWRWMDGVVNYFNHRQIRKFSECWLPAPGASLLGPLSTDIKGVKTRYIGYLSRFEKKHLPVKNDVLVICSGPEPQRGIFENLLTTQLQSSKLRYKIVRGDLSPAKSGYVSTQNSHVSNFMNSEELNVAIEESKIIVSRSGYSTVMDLAKLGSKAIFIPTPNQTEQEHLATELRNRGIAFSMGQSSFDIEKALQETDKYAGFVNFEQDTS